MLSNNTIFSIRSSTFLFAGIVLFFSIFVTAEENIKVSVAPQLLIEPSICVLESSADHCNRLIILKLNHKTDEEFCVYVIANKSKKQCYKPEQANEFSYSINTKETVMLVVENKPERKIIAQATLKISQYIPVNTRKRRRYGWNLL
jgi:hypothetical protein